MHGARGPFYTFTVFAVAFVFPCETIECAGVGAGVLFESFFEESNDGGFCGADGAVEEEDAFVCAEALCGGFKDVDEAFEGFVEPEDGVAAVVDGIRKKVVLDDVVFEECVFFVAVGEDHVVDTLESVAGDLRFFGDDVEIFGECAVPMLMAKFRLVESSGDHFE